AFALTHFFSGKKAGAHQLKYGSEIDSVRLKQSTRYSGQNDADFYNNCSERGLIGGGEYCYDPQRGEYLLGANDIGNANRVNNNRIIIVDADNPDNRRSLGFGRVR